MKVEFSFVGCLLPDESQPRNIQIDLPQVPQVGDIINVKDLSQADTYVRTVVWYLTHGDDGEEIEEPFVYVVVGPNRPESPPSAFDRYLYGDDKPLRQI